MKGPTVRGRTRESALVGTRPLLVAALHQEARSFAPWVLFVTVLTTSSVVVYPRVFPTDADREGLAAALGTNPALGLIFGPARDISTTDGFTVWRSLALGGLLTALMAIFTVVRASRAQEDSGQAELLASGVLGRSARLAVAVALAGIGSVVAGVVCAVASGLAGADWSTMLLLAATFTVSGWVFGALAAVASQLASEARTAASLAIAALGGLFVANGYLHSVEAPTWTSWITPQGWLMETAPATEPSWWPLAAGAGAAAVLLAVAFRLQARRDFGLGVIAPRPGPARGTVRTPQALAWRLNRSSVAAWTGAFVVLGFVFGSFATSVTDLLADNSAAQGVLASGASTSESLVAAFLVTIMSLVGIIGAVSGVQVVLRVRNEELADRVEPLLAGSVRRHSYLGANILVALAGPAVGLVVAGTIIAAIAAAGDIGVTFGEGLLQAVATVPAVWTATALAVAVVGARPAVRLVSWVGVVASFGLTILGPTFGLDEWALAISPFWHVPQVSEATVDWTGLGWISVVTLALLVVGAAGFRRRDVAVD